MVNNSTYVNKTNESLNSDGQQFYLCRQYENELKQKRRLQINQHKQITTYLKLLYWQLYNLIKENIF